MSQGTVNRTLKNIKNIGPYKCLSLYIYIFIYLFIYLYLYILSQSVKVRLNRGETRSVKTGRGVRQGCCLSPILFKLYSEYLTKKALEGLRDFKIGRQIIHTVKYADDLVLLAKEEKVLQDMIDKLNEIGRCYGMEMNVEKTKVVIISRQPSLVKIMIDQIN